MISQVERNNYIFQTANWDLIPDHMQGAMYRYVMHGLDPGSFLLSALANDLMGTLSFADSINKNFIPQYGEFIHSWAPGACHGSPEAVSIWVRMGGITGYDEKRAQARAAGI